MGYEAREDARNEYNSEIQAEACAQCDYDELVDDLEKYKTGYNLLMEYIETLWNGAIDPQVADELKRINL